MEEIVKEAKSLIGSLGIYARQVILGVWFPGFLLFCEAGSVTFRFFGPAKDGLFAFIAEQIAEFDSPIMSTLLGVLILATSIAAGYVSRDLAFAISDLWLRKGWPPKRTLAAIHAQICQVHGSERVNSVIGKHPVFRLVAGNPGTPPLPRMPESYVREYCKQWLRLKAPTLNTEGLETELNMVIGLVIPVALASIVFLSFVDGWPGIALAVATVAAAGFQMYRITWARDIETEQAITNFLFAHWEGLGREPPAVPV